MVMARLEQAIHYIKNISFSERTIEFLTGQGFDDEFLSNLEALEFTGEVRALPEGTLVFANEPMLEVTAPILQAQLLETAVINQIGFQTLIATKASRMRDVIDRYGTISSWSILDRGGHTEQTQGSRLHEPRTSVASTGRRTLPPASCSTSPSSGRWLTRGYKASNPSATPSRRSLPSTARTASC